MKKQILIKYYSSLQRLIGDRIKPIILLMDEVFRKSLALICSSELTKKARRRKKRTLKIISRLPGLNAATNALIKERFELLQSDGKKDNTIGSCSIKENAE